MGCERGADGFCSGTFIRTDEHSVQETYDILLRQLNSFWPTEPIDGLRYEVSDAIDLTKRGWDASTRMHYLSRGFSVFNTSVYAVFLYHLSHSIGNRGGRRTYTICR